MTTKIDTAFCQRVAHALIAAIELQDWKQVTESTAALSKELGVPLREKMEAAFAALNAD